MMVHTSTDYVLKNIKFSYIAHKEQPGFLLIYATAAWKAHHLKNSLVPIIKLQ